MKKPAISIILILFIINILPGGEPGKNPMEQLRFLEGLWVSNNPGVSKHVQYYSFELKDKYIMVKNRGEFAPTEKLPEGELHESFEVISYDSNRKLFVMRGFYVEGFVNTYTMAPDPDGKTFAFMSENIENGMPGMEAKLIYKKLSDTSFEQSFYVKFPKKDYTCFFKNVFQKQGK